jgi:hypothetical protein
MSLGIHSEVEMSKGTNLKFIDHFKIDGPLDTTKGRSSQKRSPPIPSPPIPLLPYSLTLSRFDRPRNPAFSATSIDTTSASPLSRATRINIPAANKLAIKELPP